ncbi:MAG: serine hydrolase, partial [Flavobacteriaceae bacterium]
AKLDYSDTVGTFFPELPSYMHKITLENLMQHTSGLRRTHYQEKDSLENKEIFQNFLNAKSDSLLFEPGTDLSYSNSGYMLLAMIVEKVSHEGYAQFLRENVWKPLGMSNTFVMSRDKRGRDNLAIGYDGFGSIDDFNTLTYGSNGVYASAKDLLKWMQSLTTNSIIPYENKSKAWKPAVSKSGQLLHDNVREHIYHYGYGLFIFKDELKGLIGHSGAFGGFLNIMTKDLDHNREVIILTNNGRLIPIFEVGKAINHILRGQPYVYPKISIDYELRKRHYDHIDTAIQYYQELKASSPDKYKFDNEWELNRLGYALLADDRIVDAIKIFKLLVSEFPNRPNPYDSLGEAYYRNGQFKLSVESYKEALAIDENYNVDWIRMMLQKNEEQIKLIEKGQD